MDNYIWTTLKAIAEDVIPVGHAKIAAAIVYKRQIISIGICSYKTHPLQKRYGRNDSSTYLHAEIDAITKASAKVKNGFTFNKASLYVLRVKRPNSQSHEYITGCAKPCDGCMKAIQAIGIPNVYWSE